MHSDDDYSDYDFLTSSKKALLLSVNNEQELGRSESKSKHSLHHNNDDKEGEIVAVDNKSKSPFVMPINVYPEDSIASGSSTHRENCIVELDSWDQYTPHEITQRMRLYNSVYGRMDPPSWSLKSGKTLSDIIKETNTTYHNEHDPELEA